MTVLPLRSRLGRIFHWEHAKWWLGLPLASGVGFGVVAHDSYPGLYQAAKSAPKYTYSGILSRVGTRGRNLTITLPNGADRRISCNPGFGGSRSGCISGTVLPAQARVVLFKYREMSLVLSATDDNGTVLIDEDRQLEGFSYIEKVTTSRSFLSEFPFGLILGLIASCILYPPVLAIRYLSNRFRKEV